MTIKKLLEDIHGPVLYKWEAEHILRQLSEEQQNAAIPVMAVDGDILAYRTAAVCNEAFEGACDDIIDNGLKIISTETGIHHFRVYLSGSNNFRYNVAKTKPYKGNRAGMVHPQFLDHCKKYLEEKYQGIRMDGYEADDGIATDMTITGAFHCGIDKDMLQIPGRHYNWTTKEWKDVDHDQAEITLYRQILMGDTSDNIPGLPRVGEKTAEKVIEHSESAFSDALEYYKEICADKFGADFDANTYFQEQSALITMIKDCDIDFSRTVYIPPNTEGFEAQPDEEDPQVNEALSRVQPRL